MNRTSRYSALLIRSLLLVSLFISAQRVGNGLSGPLYYPSREVPATVELVLDQAPDYPLFVFTGHRLSEEATPVPDCSREYRNTLCFYAQKVRMVLKINRQPSCPAFQKLSHRLLPYESSDEDPAEIS